MSFEKLKPSWNPQTGIAIRNPIKKISKRCPISYPFNKTVQGDQSRYAANTFQTEFKKVPKTSELSKSDLQSTFFNQFWHLFSPFQSFLKRWGDNSINYKALCHVPGNDMLKFQKDAFTQFIDDDDVPLYNRKKSGRIKTDEKQPKLSHVGKTFIKNT